MGSAKKREEIRRQKLLDLGEMIMSEIEKRGFSYTDLCRTSNVIAGKSYYAIQRGNAGSVTLKTLIKLLDALDMDFFIHPKRKKRYKPHSSKFLPTTK